MTEQDFLKHYIQNAPHMMWFLGAGTSRSAGLPTANDIIWDLKLKHYCVRENQDIKAHDINNKAIRSMVQSYLDSRGCPALGTPEEYSYYFELVFGDDRAAQQKYIVQALATSKVSLTVGHRALGALLAGGHPSSPLPQIPMRLSRAALPTCLAATSRLSIWRALTLRWMLSMLNSFPSMR